MSKDDEQKTIDELLAALDQEIAWFHGEEFQLEQARERFLKVKGLAEEAEQQLLAMKNEIEVLSSE